MESVLYARLVHCTDLCPFCFQFAMTKPFVLPGYIVVVGLM